MPIHNTPTLHKLSILRNSIKATGMAVGLLLLVLASQVIAQSPDAPSADDPPANEGNAGPSRFGWIEPVLILNDEVLLKAKLDSGAKTSSLDASDIEYFDWNGKRWVRFTITDPVTNTPIVLERPRVRDVIIKRHNSDHQRRPVILMEICLGNYAREVEINLIDRSEFLYRLLLGRSALDSIAIIDPGATLLSTPGCDGVTSNIASVE